MERRVSPRVNVTNPIHVRSVDTKVPLLLIDVGEGGLSVGTSTPLPVGVVMRFEFVTGDGLWTAFLSGQSVYCRSREDQGAEGYQTGFMYLNKDAPAIAQKIGELFDRATVDSLTIL